MPMKQDRIGFLDECGKIFFGVGLSSKPISAPLLEYYRALCAVASPRATLQCLKSFSSTDFRNEMKLVSVSTLIIHGDEDKTVPIGLTAQQSAKLIPDNQFITCKGAPHGLFYAERQKLNADLVKFLGS